MAACTFFGHRDCFGLSTIQLEQEIRQLIGQGVDTFYVGNQGQFDRTVYGCLKRLRTEYPFIQVWVVLAYLPGKGQDGEDTLYPEGMEFGPQKFAIDRRNRWMIRNCQHCLCYIDHTWGGAYKYAALANRCGLQIRNFGSILF